MLLKCSECYAKSECDKCAGVDHNCSLGITDDDIKKESRRLESAVMKDMHDSMIMFEEFVEGVIQNT